MPNYIDVHTSVLDEWVPYHDSHRSKFFLSFRMAGPTGGKPVLVSGSRPSTPRGSTANLCVGGVRALV